MSGGRQGSEHTYLDLLQVLEDVNNIFAHHERIVCILGVQVIPVITEGINLLELDYLLDLSKLSIWRL